MTNNLQPDYVAIARSQYPGFSVKGSGQFAVLCRQTTSIELFSTALEGRIASMVAHENCAAVLHKKILLPAPQKNTNLITRSPADMERER
jgi:hypothetical protein